MQNAHISHTIKSEHISRHPLLTAFHPVYSPPQLSHPSCDMWILAQLSGVLRAQWHRGREIPHPTYLTYLWRDPKTVVHKHTESLQCMNLALGAYAFLRVH